MRVDRVANNIRAVFRTHALLPSCATCAGGPASRVIGNWCLRICAGFVGIGAEAVQHEVWQRQDAAAQQAHRQRRRRNAVRPCRYKTPLSTYGDIQEHTHTKLSLQGSVLQLRKIIS